MKELPKAYRPDLVEEKWYDFWKKKGYFQADPLSEKKPFSIMLPPPNVTGVLHMGHALVDTLQDILIRFKRMQGFETLWLPGTDHAGISTQTVVERNLIEKTGKRRKEFTREEFLGHVWKWKEDNETRIISQLKRLGCSCDWTKQRFTMDKEANLAVRTTFKKMYDDGLIYRGNYLVNWDPITQTALADDEVEYEEHNSCLWYFRYPLEGKKDYVIIATTRPETMLGDTAVAVSPKDERFQSLIGKTIRLPFTNRLIPIIQDHYVDPKFGSGVVKITPAHDPNDYDMGLRHNLPMINIMTPDGHINKAGGDFEGLSMADARTEVVKRMKELGLIEKIEPHLHRVGVSYRSKAIIEPYLSKQWFVRLSSFKERLMDIVKNHEVTLVPKNWENTYFHWIENLRDWCISRQLWWGHRIPIWYHKQDKSKIICYPGDDLPEEVKQHPEDWFQDEDVLDTWFSSALWPFSALGWPHDTHTLKKFYPNSTLITGHDILFFWVARMILMGDYVMGKVPFKDAFLHGLIYGKSYFRKDQASGIQYASPKEKQAFDLGKPLPQDIETKWEKMSKSKGNVIDPLEIIHSYGADAMRMALCSSATHARQIDLDRRRFEEFKNFANKVWNGARFVLMHLQEDHGAPLSGKALSEGLDFALLQLEDRWILSLLNRVIQEVNHHLESYEFDQAALRSYTFFWDEFCAYYVEISKPALFGKYGNPALKTNKQKLLVILLLASIRLMHPMAPFITEEIFSLLKTHFHDLGLSHSSKDPYTTETLKALSSPACIVSAYPQVIAQDDLSLEIESTFQKVSDVVYAIRNIRAEMGLPPHLSTDIFLIGKNLGLIQDNKHIITSLVRVNTLSFLEEESPSKGFCASAIVSDLKIMIPLPKDLQEKEKLRLQKEEEKLRKQLSSLKQQLENQSFLEKAPQALVEQKKQTQKDIQLKLDLLLKKLKSLLPF